MKVKLKKNCNAEEHGLLGSAGDFIHVAKEEAHKLVDELKKKYDNQAAVLDIVEQPFGRLGNRKLKDISKPTSKSDEDLPFEEDEPSGILHALILYTSPSVEKNKTEV